MELPKKPLRLEYLDPASLSEHPDNWKFHGSDQLESLDEFMGSVGWAGALLLNERTGRLLDGHGRRQLTLGKGELVPVLVGNWTEEQERQILLMLDPLGWMSTANKRALESLRQAQAAPPKTGHLQALLDLVSQAADLLPGSPAEDGAPGDGDGRGSSQAEDPAPKRPSASEVPNALFPSDNPWGVPLLDALWQADVVEAPVTLWGSQGQSRRMPGTWVFYTQDEVFDSLWENPGKVLPSGAPCCVEPNWSTTDQAPFAVSLWSIYRRRWIARYWQSQGRRVFVDLNLHHSLLEPHEAVGGRVPAFLGVPKEWRAYASRAHGNRPEMLEAEHAAAVRHAGTESLLYLVYGGGKRVEEMAKARGWVWIPERADSRKRQKESESS